MTLVDALRDPALFGPLFDPATWGAWLVFLKAVFGLPMTEADCAVYAKHTGRTTPPDHASGHKRRRCCGSNLPPSALLHSAGTSVFLQP